MLLKRLLSLPHHIFLSNSAPISDRIFESILTPNRPGHNPPEAAKSPKKSSFSNQLLILIFWNFFILFECQMLEDRE